MNEDVVFWKWVTPKMIGLVTELSVFHWNIEGDSVPLKMFDRVASLQGSQIISYRINSSENWMVLVGISALQGMFSNLVVFDRYLIYF